MKPTHITVPVELWEKVEALLKLARNTRTDPANWPLEPEQMAQHIRHLHIQLRQIDEWKAK